MDIRVEINFSPKAEDLLNRLITVFGESSRTVETSGSCVEEKIDFEDTENTEKSEQTEQEEVLDTKLLRQTIKNLSIKIARSGKSEKVKALTKEYGVEKQSELPEELLNEYLSKLKEM